jgi:hypothetical protein
MKTEIRYRYLGTNGVINSNVHLEGIYSVRSWILTADTGYRLTKDGKNFVQSVKVTDEAEIAEWKEVKDNSH